MHRLRTFIGLLAITATLISIFYITSKGSDKTKNNKDSLLVQNLKQTNRANQDKIEELEKQLGEIKAQKETTQEQLSKAANYITNMTVESLTQEVNKCINSAFLNSNYDFSEQDISKYKTAFTNKNAEVRKFLTEKTESNKARSLELGGVISTNVILLYAVEVKAQKITPVCEVSKTTFGTYEYDYKKGTFKKV